MFRNILKPALIVVASVLGILVAIQIVMLFVSFAVGASFGYSTGMPHLVSSIVSPILFLAFYFLFLHKFLRTKIVILAVCIWLAGSISNGYFDWKAKESINSEFYFDSSNGVPLLRYFVDGDGKISLFPRNIKRHPEFGTKLKLIDFNIIWQYKKQQKQIEQDIQLSNLEKEANDKRKYLADLEIKKWAEIEVKKYNEQQKLINEQKQIDQSLKEASVSNCPIENILEEQSSPAIPENVALIKIWNQHNGGAMNAGTKSINLKLYLGGELASQIFNHKLEYSKINPAFDSFKVSGIQFDSILIEIESWYGIVGGLSEVEILTENGENIANKFKVIASAPHICTMGRKNDLRSADKLIDGITDCNDTKGVGFCLLPINQKGYFKFTYHGLDNSNP